MKLQELFEDNDEDILYDVARHLEAEAWSGEYEFDESSVGFQKGKVVFPDEDLEMNITLSRKGGDNVLLQLSYQTTGLDLGKMVDDDSPEAAALKAKLANKKKKPKVIEHEVTIYILGKKAAAIGDDIEHEVDEVYMEMPREEMQ